MLLHGGRVLSCGFCGWCNVGCDAFGGRLSRPFHLTCGDFRKWNKRTKFPAGVGFELERVKDAELIHAIVLLWQIGSMNGNSETPLALKAAVMKNFHLFKKKSRISIVCVICAPRENKEAEINIIAASTRLNNSMARGARKPSAHNTYADWRGDGNTRKRRKQTEVPPCVRSPLLPCALFSRCKNLTSEWGGASFPPAACQLNHVQIFTQWSRRGALTISFFPLFNAWGGWKKKNKNENCDWFESKACVCWRCRRHQG